jgi:hypothetical protein
MRTELTMKAIAAALLLGSLTTVEALAVVRNVPADYPTIQAALNASSSGDIVLVAPGTYAENLSIGFGQNGVALVSQSGPAVTRIDGGGVGTVIRCSSVGPTTRIEGFTITNGGGATVGGGLSLSDADVEIRNNVIERNVAVAAGAIYSDFSSPLIIDNVIRDNEAPGGSGGGIYCDHAGTARIERNIIARNVAGAYGGGVTAWENASPTLVSNTIVLNRAALDGGGLFLIRRGQAQLTRNIVAANPQGGGIRVDDGISGATLQCNDVWGNAGYDYSGLPDPTGNNGNISADPQFCDLTMLNVHLLASSPCAPANSPPGCDLIGARGVDCNPVPTLPTTWGRLKVGYH